MSAISFSSSRCNLLATSAATGAFKGQNSMNDDLSKIGHILIVDDDPETREMMVNYFADQNLPTSFASTRSEVNRHFTGRHPCLIVIDLQLGQEDSLDLLRSIRTRSDVPIIIIGHRSNEIDRVVGLELGADDYIVKPFSLRELLARIRAVLRRQEMARVGRARDPERGGYQFNGWRLARSGRTLVNPEGAPVSLSRREYDLLLAFLESPQRPLTREYLLQATRVHEDIFDRSIDVHILRLRRKLETDPKAPRMIQTVRGVGYIFALAPEPF